MFLYTRGTKGEISEELQQFLQYMEHTSSENARNEVLVKIHEMVEKVKDDREVLIEFMKIFEREQMLIRQGIEQGRKLEMQRAEDEKKRADSLQKEVEQLRMRLQKLQAQKL